jgi:hypothetical protein
MAANQQEQAERKRHQRIGGKQALRGGEAVWQIARSGLANLLI